MSSVNSSDNTYNGYYIKHLSDMEDELKADYERAQAHSREEVADLEKRYMESARETQDKADATVDQIRNDMQEKYDKNRENDRQELEQIRRQSYDRFGRDRSNEADQYKLRLDQALKSNEAERTANEARIKEAESVSGYKSEEMARRYKDSLDSAIQAERESSGKAFENLKSKQNALAETQREDAIKKYELLSAERAEEQTEARRRTNTLISDNERDTKNLVKHLNDTIDHRLEKDHQAGVEHEEQSARDLRASHDLQSRALREQISSLLSESGNPAKEAAKARSEAVRDYEDGWRSRFDQAQSASTKEIQKLHEKMEESETNSSIKSSTHAKERETYYADLMAKQAKENHDEKQNTVAQYDKALKDTDKRSKREHDAADNRLEQALHSAGEQREDALKEQAEKFRESASLQKHTDNESIEALQKQLRMRNEATDDFDVPPAVEASVRRSIVKQYTKNLNAETDRNKRAMDSMQRSYGERLQSQHEDSAAVLAARDHQNRVEQHQSEVVLMDKIQDVESQKEEALRSSSQEHDRQTETLNRVSSQAQVRQRNEYEGILQNLKDDASARIQATRQESEFALKTQQRAFSVQQNELIRQYEKKLADQKLDFDTRLEEIRNQTAQTVRDHDRREKFNYDEQARTYEQRIAQLEDQHKERERSITQNFEDQLDKVKRSNALLQSKKG